MIEHKPFHSAMIAAVQQTLENMVFMEIIEERGTPREIPARDLVWSSLLVNDPIQGEIRLAVPAELLKKITSNVFGIDEEEVTTSQAYDILNELLNTIAGLFMTNLLPENQQYSIGLPSLEAGNLPDVDEHTLVWHLINGDNEPLKIHAAGDSLVALYHNTN
jgi:CheY-specific phosphatase CheX